MIILGVDPGSVSGAYAILDTLRGTVEAYDLPVVDRNVSAAQFAKDLELFGPEVAVVERVGAMPKQGVSSMFAFGRSVGIIQGVLGALRVPTELVTPVVWKRHFKLGTDKEKSRELAIRLYPEATGLTRKKDAGKAEAILIARWYAEKRA